MIWKSIVSPRAIPPASARWSAMSCFASKTAETVSDFASVLHNLVMDVRDTYRPELHYMRGPGPKWRAKHQPWLKFNSESGGRHELPRGSLLRRNAANRT
jgi:hypothetical protein